MLGFSVQTPTGSTEEVSNCDNGNNQDTYGTGFLQQQPIGSSSVVECLLNHPLAEFQAVCL